MAAPAYGGTLEAPLGGYVLPGPVVRVDPSTGNVISVLWDDAFRKVVSVASRRPR